MLSAALLDLATVPLALGYAIGRIGCQISGDGDFGAWCYRGTTPVTCPGSKLPWSMGYPHGTVPDSARGQGPADADLRDAVDGTDRMVRCGGCETDSVPGALFALYLVLSGIERLLVEFLRRNHRIVIGLTAPQLESVALVDRSGRCGSPCYPAAEASGASPAGRRRWQRRDVRRRTRMPAGLKFLAGGCR